MKVWNVWTSISFGHSYYLVYPNGPYIHGQSGIDYSRWYRVYWYWYVIPGTTMSGNIMTFRYSQ